MENLTENKPKKFRCFWGTGYAIVGEKTVKIDFFTDDRGYTQEMRTDIEKLQVGEEADLTETPGGVMQEHTVTRIQ